ncbi:MAG: glycerophosphodiester phosphodiesterase family protein [Pseudomonadota bacterium]
MHPRSHRHAELLLLRARGPTLTGPLRWLGGTLLTLALLGCGAKPEAPVATQGPLPAYFDCVRDAQALLIATHRAGPAPGYPENALETLQHAWSQGLLVHEVDVAESRDGVLFLMHDRSLGRTTTGEGQVVDRDWAQIRATRLVDPVGQETAYHPPTLADVLRWAVEAGAVLELDRKRSTSFRNIIDAVRTAGAQQHVVLISYSDSEASLIARLAPELMLSASARNPADVARLAESKVATENLLAWTGTRSPDAQAFAALRQLGIEPVFGTLGRRGERLDDRWLADGDAGEYGALVAQGLVLLATDRPYEVAQALRADERAVEACGLPFPAP